MPNLDDIIDKIQDHVDPTLVVSYDRIREKTNINRDLDFICDVKNYEKTQEIIDDLLAPEYRLFKVISNYYSKQLFYCDKGNKVVQIDLMDGVYVKHWQLNTADHYLNTQLDDSTPYDKILKYIMSRVYQLKRLTDPPGELLVVMGTDGSGKTTTIKNLIKNIETNNQKVIYKYLFPGYFKRFKTHEDRSANSDPHGREPYDLVSSILHQAFWSIEYILGSINDRYLLYLGYTIIYDRYYQDFEADPARYRLKRPTITKLLKYLLPKQSLVILYGEAHVIALRKNEVSTDQTAKIQNKLHKILNKHNGKKIAINTTIYEQSEVADQIFKNLLYK